MQRWANRWNRCRRLRGCQRIERCGPSDEDGGRAAPGTEVRSGSEGGTVRLLATLLTRPEAQSGGIGAEQVTLATMGVGAAVWAGKFITGRLREDAAEKLELAAAVKRADEAFDTLSSVVAELKVSVAKCETHREHDGAELSRLRTELDAVKAKQNARLAGDGPA
jgi:hypothetical protein